MTNHIHLIAVPETEKALAQALGLAHQRYSSLINAQHGWTGNLWANRFYARTTRQRGSAQLTQDVDYRGILSQIHARPIQDAIALMKTELPFLLA